MKTRSALKHSILPSSGRPVPSPFKAIHCALLTRIRPFARLLPALLSIFTTCSLAHAHSDGANLPGDARTPAMLQTDARGPVNAIPVAPADPAIQDALAQVSSTHIEHTIATLVSFYNRNTLSSMDTGLPPADTANARGASAAADWIEAELRRYSADCGGCLEVHRDTFTEPAGTGPASRIPRPTTISNIYAILRGSDPLQARRMFLVTGHYDSRGTDVLDTRKQAPGANDDASGVAVSLESARVLSKLHLPATLVFVAVAGEEQGLNGSAHLAHLARTAGWQLEAVLNNDIVGGDTTPGDMMQDKSLVRVFSEGLPSNATPDQLKAAATLGGDGDSPSRELARAVADVAATYFRRARRASSTAAQPSHTFHPVLEFRRDRYLRGGDHISFNDEGFAAIRFTEWRENFNHQHQDLRTENGIEYGDLLKFVDFHYVAKVARLNAATLATLASAPPPPEAVKMETRALDNNTTLKWTAADDSNRADTKGEMFEILWRATAAPDWQFAHLCDSTCLEPGQQSARQFKVTLPVSKDDYIFGVRAIDAKGHRSLVVIPAPER